ncbi:hypothetical protein PS3A_02120 [Pseudomonas sp. 3A(2025)]
MKAKEPVINKDLQEIITYIETIEVFDKKFYRSQVKGKPIKFKNLIEHYLMEGWKTGFEPHPCFHTVFYWQHHADVRETKMHPFIHFVMHGHREDRYTRKDFSLSDYRRRHPDIDVHGINPFKHYTQTYGQAKQLPETSSLYSAPKDPANINEALSTALSLGLFDKDWYNETYGKSFEDAKSAFSDYLFKSRFSPVNPSLLFDSETYHRLNFDVYHLQMSPLYHYLMTGKKEGRACPPAIRRWNPRTTLTIAKDLLPDAQQLKIAVCLHIYYEDYIERFSQALNTFPVDVDVFITLANTDHEARARDVFSKHPRVNSIETRCVPNRGRNFGPLLVEFAEALQGYDLFCHLHSKKSLYSGREQTQWSDYLTEYLMRDESVVTRVVNAFQENPDLGVYYPTTFWMMPSWVNHITMNKGFMKTWQQDLGLDEHDGFLSYPAGGMFWARPEALKGIIDRSYDYEFFPAEPLPNDGSLLHALERMIGLLAEHNGYKQFFYYPPTGQFTLDQSYTVSSYVNSVENVQAQLRNFSTISFDVFDTLVRREYSVPDYAKLLLGKELVERKLVTSPQAFVALRNDAEFQLRQRANFQGDVGIRAIYTELGEQLKIHEDEAQRLMQREFELDLNGLCAKDEMVDMFNNLGSLEHTLWVISDTYYTRDQIGLILKKAGISVPYRLLVSSEEQKRKDNGTMWRMIKSDLQRDEVTRYIHVGDNVVADCQLPGDLGLTTLHILHPVDKWKALGFPAGNETGSSLDEYTIKKWGKLISCIGRVPFL